MRRSLRTFWVCASVVLNYRIPYSYFFPCNTNLGVYRDCFYPLSMHSLYLRAHTWETEAVIRPETLSPAERPLQHGPFTPPHSRKKKEKKVATNSNIAHTTLKGKKRRDETFSLKQKCGWLSTWIFGEHSIKLFKLFSLKKIFTLFIIVQNSQLDVWPKGSEAS